MNLTSTSHSSDVSAGGGAAVDNEKDPTKLLLRIKHLDEEVTTLIDKVTAVPDPTGMYDPEI